MGYKLCLILPVCCICDLDISRLVLPWNNVAAVGELDIHHIHVPEALNLVDHVNEIVWDEIVATILIVVHSVIHIQRSKEECKVVERRGR